MPTIRGRSAGLVLIGPTAFGHQVAPGVHTTVILPFCDGDVTDLEGQQYVDIGRDLTRDRALRTSVMAMGTNHNFYNTEWTPGLSKSPAWDDWFSPADPQCGETASPAADSCRAAGRGSHVHRGTRRPRSRGQQRVVAGARRHAAVKPSSIGRAATAVHAIGGDKQLLLRRRVRTSVSRRNGLTAAECRGFYAAGHVRLARGLHAGSFLRGASTLAADAVHGSSRGAPRALNVGWQQAGGGLLIPLTET